MKILYIGNERRNAQAVATALRAFSQSVTISWTQNLDNCAKYLAQNRDLAALVMDAQVHAGPWPSSLQDLRSLHVRPAIVVVVPHGTPPTFDSLAPPPDDYVINGPTFQRDLPTAVARAVARVRGSQPAPATPNDVEEPQRAEATPERTGDVLPDLSRTAQADLERKLAELTAAFQQAQRRHAAAMAAERVAHELAAAEQLTEQERQFQAQITLERDKRRTVEEMLTEAASALEEADRRYAAALAQSHSERARCTDLEQAVADAGDKIRETQQRHDAALAKASEELVEQRTRFDRELSRTAVEGDQLRERLIKAELALNESRHEHESAAADAARLTQREADLSAQLAQAKGDRKVVEGKLSDALREVADTQAAATRERAAAENRLELKLARQIDAREILERKLSEALSTAFDAERKFREETAALRTHAQERETYFNTRLASERLEYDNRLAETQQECERLGQARVAADEDVQRLSAELSDAKRILEDTRREFQNRFDRQSTEHAMALAASAASIAERDERLNEQAARHDVALRASERARAELQERLAAALAAGRQNIQQVQERLMATIEALEATKLQQENLQTEADRIPESHEHDHDSRTKDPELVQQSGLALQHNEDAALV